jgi:O-antigen/teichoic acid export membrane protein
MKKEFFPGLENLKIIHKNLNDPLYKNSIYLILNTLIIGVLGFIFWTINAKLYSVEEIGLVTTIISIMGLIASFSNLGFGTSLIRHLFQSKAKNENINTYFIISSIIAFVGSIIFLLGVKTFSSGLEFIQKNLFLSIGFIFVMIISTINSLVESVFVLIEKIQNIF